MSLNKETKLIFCPHFSRKKYPQIITLPPPDLTVGSVFFGEFSFAIFPPLMISIIITKQLNLISSVHNTLWQNECSFSLCCLMNFKLAPLCHFNRRGVFFGLRDFRPFPSISLLIIRLVTVHPDKPKSSCSFSRVTIGFWLIRRPNFLDNQGEIFFRTPALFWFQLCYVF